MTKKKKKEPDYTEPRFFSLSVKDLLEARENFHFHLSNLKNVVGTAIGLYRIRNKDLDAKDSTKKADRKKAALVRTLANSAVKDWSWPCILVFVSKWQTIKEFERAREHDDVIPRFVYMPDGRRIPLCVVEAEKNLAGDPPLQNFSLPNQLMGGGYPIFSDVQGQQHLGSLGCLVTDGDRVYGLTNRHVVGEKTAVCIGEGCLTLASLWKRAWEEGNGEEIPDNEISEIGRDPLKAIYDNKEFLKSLKLDDPKFLNLLADST